MLRIIIALLSNLAAILAAEYLIAGFEVADDLFGLGTVVVLFAVANSFILPMFKVILKPFSWLTLGLLPLLLNGVLIYVVDILSDNITISGLASLIYATIIVGVINALFALGATAFKKN